MIKKFLTLPVVGIVIEGTHEQVKRGKYLAHHVTVCMDCHSDRNQEQFSGPLQVVLTKVGLL